MESVHPCPPASRRHHRGVSSVVIPSGHRALAHIARVPLSGIAKPIHGLGQTLSPRRPPSPRASHSLLLTTRTPTCSDPSIRRCVASSLGASTSSCPQSHHPTTSSHGRWPVALFLKWKADLGSTLSKLRHWRLIKAADNTAAAVLISNVGLIADCCIGEVVLAAADNL
ncbi:hypothetical protein PAHAL_7G088500 [Panicum hallii]|uniref:Uncharacterized protein n=1 Tax=Panicum hallii TaxID=206008 RepID=A0A2S3I5G2_9POAL|nr:hypothetical protein PAHAL_7G088500 [Panicum hallii]